MIRMLKSHYVTQFQGMLISMLSFSLYSSLSCPAQNIYLLNSYYSDTISWTLKSEYKGDRIRINLGQATKAIEAIISKGRLLIMALIELEHNRNLEWVTKSWISRPKG